jgi:hypothetical protein
MPLAAGVREDAGLAGVRGMDGAVLDRQMRDLGVGWGDEMLMHVKCIYDLCSLFDHILSYLIVY